MENAQSLKSLVLQKLRKGTELSDFESAILDDACEQSIELNPVLLLPELIPVALTAFLTARKIAQLKIQAGFVIDNEVTVNYRGQTFVIRDPLYS